MKRLMLVLLLLCSFAKASTTQEVVDGVLLASGMPKTLVSIELIDTPLVTCGTFQTLGCTETRVLTRGDKVIYQHYHIRIAMDSLVMSFDLAFVLAHELGHVVIDFNRTVAERVTQNPAEEGTREEDGADTLAFITLSRLGITYQDALKAMSTAIKDGQETRQYRSTENRIRFMRGIEEVCTLKPSSMTVCAWVLAK